MLDKLTCESFAGKEGQTFTLETPGGSVDITLLQAKATGIPAAEEEERPAVEGQSARQPFQLLFAGPDDRELYPGVYSLAHAEIGKIEGVYLETVVVEGEEGEAAVGQHLEAVFC